MESAAVLKRGVGYEMSRLGHYLTQARRRDSFWDKTKPRNLCLAVCGIRNQHSFSSAEIVPQCGNRRREGSGHLEL